MKWFLVDKSKAIQPSGTYNTWKPLLREEGRFQCIYCTIHEGQFGGTRNFHVEHYRPKKKFSDLENNIVNLFYACGICNSFKSDDWPADPAEDHSLPAYPDPSRCNYGDILSVDSDAQVAANSIAGKYVVERLNLNRPQLVSLRAVEFLLRDLGEKISEIESLLPSARPEVGVAAASVLIEVSRLFAGLPFATPYESEDVRRS